MLKRVLVGVIAVPLLVLLILLAPKWAFAAFIAIVTAFASWELLRAMAKPPLRMQIYTSVIAAILPVGFLFGSRIGLLTLGFAALVLLTLTFTEAILCYGRVNALPYDAPIKCMFAGVFVPTLLTSLVVLHGYGAAGHGRMYVMLTIGLAFITDGGAYFIGVLFGHHRGITGVSPNKSAEGFIGGMIIGILFSLCFGLVLQFCLDVPVRFLLMAVYGLAGSLVTIIGDLAFSLVKRECAIKDFGKIIPGHGGVMDRFDSMVFCAPMVLLFSQCFAVF